MDTPEQTKAARGSSKGPETSAAPFSLSPSPPGTYQVQLVTLNPLRPATSLLLAFLHALQLVPFPAHCGLQRKRVLLLDRQPGTQQGNPSIPKKN